MKGSHFCYAHKGHFKDYPPVKITALICPYCEESLKMGAEFCSFCKRSLFKCLYCEEPLREIVRSCSFCKQDLTPVKPIAGKPEDYDKLIEFDNSNIAVNTSLGVKILFLLPLLLILQGLFIFVVYCIYLLDN